MATNSDATTLNTSHIALRPHSEQVVKRSIGVTSKGVPYTELSIEYFMDYPIDVTFRAYTKNVWVAYEDGQYDMPGGADLEECYLAPPTIFKKVPIKQFNLREVLLDLAEHFGIADHLGIENIYSMYSYIDDIVTEAQRLRLKG